MLVHCGHCESCNDVTHILANVLMQTGHIYCFLDLCSTQDVGKKGLKWYQEKFESSEKVVIICTKESKKIEEHDYDESMLYTKVFFFLS